MSLLFLPFHQQVLEKSFSKVSPQPHRFSSAFSSALFPNLQLF
jgi:hypothetical protein